MGNEKDLYSTDFTYGIIVIAVALHLTVMAIIIYFLCRNNRCQCCVVHCHDNNITTVVVSHGASGSENHYRPATDNGTLIDEGTTRPGASQETYFLARVRTRISDIASGHSEGLPPPYDEASDHVQGEINEGFMTVDLPTYEEYTEDHPPVYEEGSSPPKYDEIF